MKITNALFLILILSALNCFSQQSGSVTYQIIINHEKSLADKPMWLNEAKKRNRLIDTLDMQLYFTDNLVRTLTNNNKKNFVSKTDYSYSPQENWLTSLNDYNKEKKRGEGIRNFIKERKETGKTKKILGYECKEIIATIDKPGDFVFYETSALPAFSPVEVQCKFLGAVLEASIRGSHYVATAMQKGLKDKKILAAEDYKMAESKNLEILNYDWTGKDAPLFNAYDIKGKEVSLQKLKGKIVVLNFWFIACSGCVKEMPELNELVEKYKGKDVVFIGITGYDKKEAVEKFLEKTKFLYNIIASGKDIAQAYKVQLFPENIVINRDGKVVFNASGGDAGTIEKMKVFIDMMLK